jgi:AcrR family transcriptional regulator
MNMRSDTRPPVRELILRAALGLYAETGFARATTGALARRAGIAEGTLFRHFRSKDEILIALLTQVRNRLMEALGKYLGNHRQDPGYERVLSTVQGYYTFATRYREEFSIIFRDTYAHEEARQIIGSTYTFLAAYLQKAIEDGQADGTITRELNSADTASIILGACVGLARGVHFSFISESTNIPAELKAFCARALKV